MKNLNYSTTVEVTADPIDVFNCINDVPGWFKDKGFEGSSTKPGDEFIFRYGEGDHAHYSKQQLAGFIPGKKVVWLITDSKINWIPNNKEEWTNTRVIFEISENDNKTVLHFTHEGLVPELNCYPNTVLGWNMIIKEWLFNFINAKHPNQGV